MKGIPISPSDIPARKTEVIPPHVFDAVNQLLIQRADGASTITLLQKDIVALIKEIMPPGVDFVHAWLNFEDAYREKGWIVKYDKPAYCESYDAFFEFKQK